MITIRTYTDHGPYWGASRGIYQASCLKDVLFHVRLSMEDGEHLIGAFNEDGTCYGLWEDDSEPEPDGKGGWIMPRGYYTLRRPGGLMAGHFNALVNQCRGKG